ncbi:MAG: hypothetical protein WCP86_08945, partial [bacterium]
DAEAAISDVGPPHSQENKNNSFAIIACQMQGAPNSDPQAWLKLVGYNVVEDLPSLPASVALETKPNGIGGVFDTARGNVSGLCSAMTDILDDLPYRAGDQAGVGYSRPKSVALEKWNAMVASRSMWEIQSHVLREFVIQAKRQARKWLKKDPTASEVNVVFEFLPQKVITGEDFIRVVNLVAEGDFSKAKITSTGHLWWRRMTIEWIVDRTAEEVK